MDNNENALALDTQFGERGIQIRSLPEAMEFASMISKSGLAPRGMNTPEQIMVAVQTGMELGLTPLRSLQSVVVINGAPTLKGEVALALIRASGLAEDIEVGCKPVEGDEKAVGYCRTWRKGEQNWKETTFSVADAKKAGLWGKTGPWSQYPKRMLQWRATGLHARDYWSDVTHGLLTTDEAKDIVTPRQRAGRSETPPAGSTTGATDPLIVDVTLEPMEPEVDPDTGEIIPDWIGDGEPTLEEGLPTEGQKEA